MLEEKNVPALKGHIAISSAKAAFALYRQIFSGARWQKLAEAGAKPQRLLWASTGNKNPSYRDTRYIEDLIGPHTVNTVPLATLDAFRDHGELGNQLEKNLEQATYNLEALARAGIEMELIAKQLEKEGILKFKEPYVKLLLAIKYKINR